MNKAFLFVVLAVILTFIGVGFFVRQQSKSSPDRILPTYGMTKTDTVLHGKDTTLEAVHRVPAFSFINQGQEQVSQKDFAGKIYVSDFFFTTCQGICPQLTATMVNVYRENKGKEHVRFLSHTVDPQTDTPEQLARYAKAHGASLPQWHFVTGDAQTLYRHARNGYLIDNREGVKEEAFVHSQFIVLVDPESRIRGFYDGTKENEHEKILRDIVLLEKEYGLVNTNAGQDL